MSRHRGPSPRPRGSRDPSPRPTRCRQDLPRARGAGRPPCLRLGQQLRHRDPARRPRPHRRHRAHGAAVTTVADHTRLPRTSGSAYGPGWPSLASRGIPLCCARLITPILTTPGRSRSYNTSEARPAQPGSFHHTSQWIGRALPLDCVGLPQRGRESGGGAHQPEEPYPHGPQSGGGRVRGNDHGRGRRPGDPALDEETGNWVLLAQFDSDSAAGMMWGNCGASPGSSARTTWPNSASTGRCSPSSAARLAGAVLRSLQAGLR